MSNETVSARLHAAIVEALENHHMCHTVEDEESALPLVDMLTPRGDKDIARGREEIERLADSIFDEVEPLLLAHVSGVSPSPEPSGKEQSNG